MHGDAACVGVLPDGHGELSRSTLALSDQKRSTLPVSESTFRHATRYTTGEPAGGERERKTRGSVMLCSLLFRGVRSEDEMSNNWRNLRHLIWQWMDFGFVTAVMMKL